MEGTSCQEKTTDLSYLIRNKLKEIFWHESNSWWLIRASLEAQMAKNLPAVQETHVQSLGWEDPLEKGMVIYSSILAWRIPWKEELGVLQSMRSQSIRHNWVTNIALHFQFLIGGLVVKKLPANAWDTGSIRASGRTPGVGNGNPLQYSCLGNPMDRGTWRATVHGVAKESDRI